MDVFSDTSVNFPPEHMSCFQNDSVLLTDIQKKGDSLVIDFYSSTKAMV